MSKRERYKKVEILSVKMQLELCDGSCLNRFQELLNFLNIDGQMYTLRIY